MNMLKPRGAIGEYSQVGVSSGVEQASPHRLIQMLMDGAIEKVAMAKGFMARNETALKGSHISWAISIIEGLRASLDKSAGGDIADNLDDLYDYMIRRLIRSNAENDEDILDEVLSLLRSVKGAWDDIPSMANHK
ncbi:MAG: flagellar export chaperone FliS [Thioalkalispiraceae bacterium]|jgi:flagellar protein FliS